MENNKMKLSGWKRIGILASIAWILGAGFHTLSTEGDSNMRVNVSLSSACESQMWRGSSNSEAAQARCDYYISDTARIDQQMQDERFQAILVAFAPLPFAWGFIYLALFLGRWVKKGFQS
jgi:hypothetical protein